MRTAFWYFNHFLLKLKIINIYTIIGKGELHLRIAFGKADQQRLEEAEVEGDKPSQIGPPATIFRISKAAEEKQKVRDRDKRFHAAKGLPVRVSFIILNH